MYITVLGIKGIKVLLQYFTVLNIFLSQIFVFTVHMLLCVDENQF